MQQQYALLRRKCTGALGAGLQGAGYRLWLREYMVQTTLVHE
jgi:hypothetical protein